MFICCPFKTCLIRFKTLISCFALFHTRKIQTYGFDSVEVEFEGPEFEAGLELGDGGEREEELLGGSQRDVRALHLRLQDLRLLLLRRDHRVQDFLQYGFNQIKN